MPASDRTVVVTTAGRSHRDDLRLRTRRYLITQGIRVACVLLAVLLPVPVAWKIGFIVGGIVLPWFGVVAANAGPVVDRKRGDALLAAAQPVASVEPAALDAARVIEHDR